MSLGPCSLSECTVAETGICLQNFAADQCPNRDGYVAEITEDGSNVEELVEITAEGRGVDGDSVRAFGGAVLARPEEIPRLPASSTLSLEDANRLRTARRATVVGVVGLPDSGKTACLASMYLLLAKGLFEGFICVNSETLMAFEEIVQGSRRWNEGNPPEQMTAHTAEMTEEREAGFLHLKLRRNAEGSFVDLLIPDLPGEWSKALIDQNDTERFDFLKSVPVIWIMVDGRQFIDAKSVNYATYRTECLIERLAAFLPAPRPRLILVASWRDLGEFPSAAYAKIQAEAERWDMRITASSIASFSNTEVVAGTGLSALMEETLATVTVPVDFWPESDFTGAERSVLAFRSPQ